MRASFLFSEVVTGLRRNITMTVAMILTTAISLGLFGGGLLVVQMTSKTQQMFLDRVEVQIFLTDDITASDPECTGEVCSTLKNDLDATAGVESVRFFNQQQAYEDFQRQFKENPGTLELARKEAFPSSFKVKLTDPERFGVIDEAFGQRLGVDTIQNQKVLVERIFAILNGIRNAAFAIAVIQAIGALLLIANMVQIAAFTRRTEVGIMRLVGASRWYTQLPFLMEAVVAGLIGSIAAVIGLFSAKALFIDDMMRDFYEAGIIGPITNWNVLLVSLVLIPVGAALSAVTAYVTLRLYVRQ
ncbi:MAG: permease-like cell division protein FtsX [Mycobacteriaceae bacterium]